MDTEKLISSHLLVNGLVLEFWDCSRRLAGDRWQVVLEVRVSIPITAANLPPDLRPRLTEVGAALGAKVVFSKQEVRNFIDAGRMPGLLQEIEAGMRRSLSGYLGHPDFAARFLGKQYRAYQEQQSLYKT